MKAINTLLLSVLLASPALAFASDDFSNPYSNPYNNPYGSTYPDGSSRPLNPWPGGRWKHDEHNTRKQQELQRQHQRQSPQPSYELPAARVTKDF